MKTFQFPSIDNRLIKNFHYYVLRISSINTFLFNQFLVLILKTHKNCIFKNVRTLYINNITRNSKHDLILIIRKINP